MSLRTLQPDGWPRPRGYANGISAVGRTIFVAGQVGWEQVLPPDQLSQLAGDERPLLIVMHPQGADCISAARQLFPTGTLTRYPSQRGESRDFLLFFVPGTTDLDESTLPAP